MITFKELYSNINELKKVNLAQRRKQAIVEWQNLF